MTTKHIFFRRIAVAALCAFAHLVPAQSSPPADLAVTNANIITIDVKQPRARALAVRNGRFVTVGSNEAVQQVTGSETVFIDAKGRTITPGFNDAHLHPEALYDDASPLADVDLSPERVKAMEDLIAALRLKAQRTPPGQWIVGGRYQDTKLGRHPTRLELDQASTQHPIRIVHSSGHVSVFNSKALKTAGITAATPDPAGGGFDRGEGKEPNGVCRESAVSVVRKAGPPMPAATEDEKIEGYQRQFQEYVKKGITSVQVAGTTLDTTHIYARAIAHGLPVRIYAMLLESQMAELAKLPKTAPSPEDQLRYGAIKLFHGNSLSGQTCWLSQPYANRPDYYGIPPARSQEELNRVVLKVHKAGLQACIHSNGDREIEMVLNAFENAQRVAPRENARPRIEHCSIVTPQILERIKRLRVVLAPHSYIYEHGDKMEAYGEGRWDMMHPNGSAVAMGIPVAGTSDSPVSAADPMLRIQSLVTRTSAEGKVYGATQKVTAEQAIRIWTLGSAYAEFAEDAKGSIEPGKLADFVLLASDPTTTRPLAIKDIAVEMTVIGGEVVFDRAREVVPTPALPKREPVPLIQKVPLGKGPNKENSGIVKSRRHKDVFWMHNDSGDEPRIYPVRRDGTVYQSEREPEVPGVLIGGAINVDWEDITMDADGHVIIADVGNNRNDRRDLVLYYVDEPSPLAERTIVKKKIFVRYPDQTQFPAPRSQFNFDCESVFTIGNQVFFLSKNRSDHLTSLYRLDDPKPHITNTLTYLNSFDIRGQAVGADASTDGLRLVVITYDAIWLFERNDLKADFFKGRIRWMPYAAAQVEAVCFADDDTLLLADEEKGTMHEVPLSGLVPVQ